MHGKGERKKKWASREEEGGAYGKNIRRKKKG